jgi:hypothetical protein
MPLAAEGRTFGWPTFFFAAYASVAINTRAATYLSRRGLGPSWVPSLVLGLSLYLVVFPVADYVLHLTISSGEEPGFFFTLVPYFGLIAARKGLSALDIADLSVPRLPDYFTYDSAMLSVGTFPVGLISIFVLAASLGLVMILCGVLFDIFRAWTTTESRSVGSSTAGQSTTNTAVYAPPDETSSSTETAETNVYDGNN